MRAYHQDAALHQQVDTTGRPPHNCTHARLRLLSNRYLGVERASLAPAAFCDLSQTNMTCLQPTRVPQCATAGTPAVHKTQHGELFRLSTVPCRSPAAMMLLAKVRIRTRVIAAAPTTPGGSPALIALESATRSCRGSKGRQRWS